MKMIVNSNGNIGQMESSQHQSENFFLKRKISLDIMDTNQSYVQPKKRLIQNFSNNFNDSCNASFNLNNNMFNSECSDIQFINYETLTPIESTQTQIIYTTTADNFDSTWSNADLLELDQKYNSIDVGPDCNVPKEPTTPQKHFSNNEQQNDTDFDDRNLSWLFNFKLDELPHLSPEVNRSSQLSPTSKQSIRQDQQMRTGRKVDELIMEATADLEENDMIVAENVVVENTPKMPKKPPFTYTELIEYALEDKGELTVSGIYQWISDRFPFYKSNDDRWKNSVRHNLSINPHFRKGVKAAQGAGHLWTISSRDSEENTLAWEHKKQRLELFFKMETSNQRKVVSQPETNSIFDEAAIAAANIAQHLRNDSLSPEPSQLLTQHDPSNDNVTLPLELMHHHQHHHNDLERSAGEILNGVHRDVEVQSVHSTIVTYQDSLLQTGDYLNPISKDDVVNESGLRQSHHQSEIDNGFYVTEIDPIELGINMCNVEEEVLFSDEFNLNYFGITGSDIVA